jgi:hydroxymethylbilane synthase
VETRIRRLDEGRFHAVVLALAGLKRLELDHRVTEILSPDLCLPAIGQGALAVECRAADSDLRKMLAVVHDPVTAAAVHGERSFLSTVEGSCQIPVACHGTLSNGVLTLAGMVAALDGSLCIRKSLQGNPADSETLGRELAMEILAAGGREILEAIRAGTV